jgi:hypothetical protein
MAAALFVLIVFGGGMLVVLSKTEIGRAIADRIRDGTPGAAPEPALVEEVERLRHDVSELQERLDFAERMLAARREPDRLGSA